jgi:purine-binding chemotaxis protein CheW
MTQLLLIARVAGERIAIDAAEIESVVELEATTPIPRAAPHVAGLAALRSRVVTVIDCLAALELGHSPASYPRDAIVVEVEGHPYALLVDAVEDVLEHSGELQPVRTRPAPGWDRVSRGMVLADDDLVLLIDVQALIAGPAALAA